MTDKTKSTDYLIWIGKSYSEVLCSKPSTNSCAIPHNHESPHCYIHEAEWRGCCRKVAQIPKLAITGHTRIFLAHKDKLKRKEQGRIFGYYILKGIEIIKGVEKPLSMPLQNFKKITTPQGTIMKGDSWDGKIKIETSKIIDEESPLLEPYPECKDGKKIEIRCDDGTFITTHVCKDGRWLETGNTCDDNGNDDNGDDDDEREEPVADNPVLNAPEQTMFETERACSLRLKPGSVYLVDALTSTITAEFSKNLEKENLKSDYSKAKSESEKEELVLRGRELFKKTVDEEKKKRKVFTEIPTELKDQAELRGAFVLFKKKSIFEKFPSASFLNFLRIDGDKIIEQVAEDKSKIEICYVDEKWQSDLSQITKSGKAYVDRFLKNLINIAKKELKSKDEFIIPGLGRFYILETKERKGRNPATGMEITIPAKKRVKFKPYKNLRNFSDSGPHWEENNSCS